MKKEKKTTKSMERELEKKDKDLEWRLGKIEGDIRWLKATIGQIKKQRDADYRLLEIRKKEDAKPSFHIPPNEDES